MEQQAISSNLNKEIEPYQVQAQINRLSVSKKRPNKRISLTRERNNNNTIDQPCQSQLQQEKKIFFNQNKSVQRSKERSNRTISGGSNQAGQKGEQYQFLERIYKNSVKASS